jgi:hypothetical protein
MTSTPERERSGKTTRRFDRLDAVGLAALVVVAGLTVFVFGLLLIELPLTSGVQIGVAQCLVLGVALGLSAVLSDAFRQVR